MRCIQNDYAATFPRLNEIDRERWGKGAGRVLPTGNGLDGVLLRSASLARQHLPNELLEHLARACEADGPAYALAGNLPIDLNLPAPPTDGNRPVTKKSWVSENVLLGTTRALGLEVLTYQQEKGGAWPQDVAPIQGREQGNHNGNRDEFGFHSDNAVIARRFQAEWIALLGLVNQADTDTRFAPLDDILTELSSAQVDSLRQPLYQVPFPESFEMGPGAGYSDPRPIVTVGPEGQMEIAVATYSVRGINAEAVDAIEGLKSVVKPPLVRWVVLQPGCLIVFSNTRCLHARGRIAGRRWAQRVYLRRSLEELQVASGTGAGCRVFDARRLV